MIAALARFRAGVVMMAGVVVVLFDVVALRTARSPMPETKEAVAPV